jgi:hypothetical protein
LKTLKNPRNGDIIAERKAKNKREIKKMAKYKQTSYETGQLELMMVNLRAQLLPGSFE